MISASMPYQKQYQDVNGKKIAYVEAGEGDPIVLLHGNPTSSYLWRNVIPELEGKGRVIAPDLIGQGDSEKLPPSDGPGRYSFLTAYQYLDGLLAAIGADRNVTLVIHDWGSSLGFYWAQQHGNERLPKLFINADPGSILTGRPREFCRSWPNQTEVTVKGTHFIQEDSPREIGQAVARWMDTLD